MSSDLPTHAFGYRSLTWWGIIGFMVIEGTAFALTIAAYFFLMSQEQGWAPRAVRAARTCSPGRLFTLIMLLSEIPNTMIKKAADALRPGAVRRLLPVMVAIGVLLFVIRGFEFNSLHVLWYDNAYGSIIWALLFLHTTHVATDWVDTVVLWRLDADSARRRRRGGWSIRMRTALYWRFVWLAGCRSTC